MSFYILHAALILAGCFTFYKLLLQKETFFQLNRAVFVCCALFSFALPLLPVPQAWSFRKAEPQVVTTANITLEGENYVPTETVSSNNGGALQKDPPVFAGVERGKIFKALIWLYWFGAGVLGLNFLVQLVLLLYRAYTRPVIRDGRFRIVEVDGDKAPCSFGNTIFINPAKYDWETYNGILAHEKIHIRQGHTYDLLLAEVVLVFQWFNPFAWLYRKDLEHNLEFLTDDQLLQAKAVEPATYQMSLLKVSAPHFPLSLTTNYNQSLLKKRFLMMNAKKSNINTTWKYLFLFPLLALFVSLLNKPIAAAQEASSTKNQPVAAAQHGLKTEGAWFATIKEDKVSIQFKNDDDEGSNHSTTFTLSELGTLPTTASGSFTVVRDAGAIVFTGKFDGKQGMGRYQFKQDDAFAAFLQKEGVKETGEEDMMIYFFVNVNRAFYAMLKAAGYKDVQKDELIPLAALKVDGAFINSMKDAGFKDLSIGDLIPLKALNVDAAFVSEIRTAGYPNITPQQIISFKAQGIDGKYIKDVRQSSAKVGEAAEGRDEEDSGEVVREEREERIRERDGSDGDDELHNIVAYKALQIDGAYIESLKGAGYDKLSRGQLISMKANGIDAAYIKTIASMGYRNVSPSNLVAMKAQGITPDFVKGFESVGFSKIAVSDLIPLGALDITPAFIKSFQEAGFPKLTLQNAIALKAQGITPALAKEYKALGFENLSINDIIGARSTGTTPAFIASMRSKGHSKDNINKYIQMKVTLD